MGENDLLRHYHEQAEALPVDDPKRTFWLEMAHYQFMQMQTEKGACRPKRRDGDTAALWCMLVTEGDTGETSPSRLAKLAIRERGIKMHGDGKASVERLARKYSKFRAGRKSRTSSCLRTWHR